MAADPIGSLPPPFLQAILVTGTLGLGKDEGLKYATISILQ